MTLGGSFTLLKNQSYGHISTARLQKCTVKGPYGARGPFWAGARMGPGEEFTVSIGGEEEFLIRVRVYTLF